MSLDPRDLLGLEFEATLFHSDYQGRKIPKIKDYFKSEELPSWDSITSQPSQGEFNLSDKNSEEEPF
jgi:hypothetical protein